jgi:hypothetical protein
MGKRIVEKRLPNKCVWCGAKNFKRDSDNTRTSVVSGDLMRDQGKVLCTKCKQVYAMTEFYRIKEKASESKSGQAGGSRLRQEDGEKTERSDA